MDLTPRFQTGQTKMNDPFQRRKIIDGSGKDDTVELPVLQNAGTDIAMNKPQVRVIAKDTGRLLQLRKIDIGSRHLGTGYLCQMMRQPAIATADLEDILGLFPPGQVPYKAIGG